MLKGKHEGQISVRPYVVVVPSFARAPITSISTSSQGLTLVRFSAQREHFLWDTLGTFSRWMGHNSSLTGQKTAHWAKRPRLS